MNLEEIYESLDVDGIVERSFQEELKRLEEMKDGKLKEMLAKKTSKVKTSEHIQNGINESLARNPNTPTEVLQEIMESEIFKKKGLLASNPNTPVDILYKLYNMGYSHSLVQNPNAPTELLQQIYDNTVSNPEEVRGQYNPNTHIFYDIARNPNAPQEVLRTLSTSRERISGSETIQGAIAKNPNTPLDILEGFAKLNEGSGIYIDSRMNVLQNPNIPEDLMNKIINMQDRHDYQYDMERFPSLYTPEYVSKLKRENGIKSLDYILVKNSNVSPGILQIIAENLRQSSDFEHVRADLLQNPNTPLNIIEKYAARIDYDWVLPGDLYSELYSIVKNPNTPSQVLSNIMSEIDKRKEQAEKKGEFANCTYVISDLLKNPNTPHEILNEYIQKAIAEYYITPQFYEVLENPKVFEALKLKKIAKTPLQQKEEELSSLEAEAKTISEAEALIDQQKEGQNIGEE